VQHHKHALAALAGPLRWGAAVVAAVFEAAVLAAAEAGPPSGGVAVPAKGLAAPLPVLCVRGWAPDDVACASWRLHLRS
jgi:hypothetical protein